MRIARPMSCVHTAAARPKRTSLAMRSASASSSKRITDSTGPNTSSCAMRMWLRTPVKMVGCTNQPVPHSGAVPLSPPSTAVAPSARAMSMYSSTLRYCGGVVIGPTWVSALIGSPMRAVRATASRRSTKASWMLSCTSSREPAMQVWPVAAKMPEIAPNAACSRSASSNTTLGDLPPSSMAVCFKRRPARSLIRRPVESEPVKLILATSGCSTSGVPTSAPKPVTTLNTPGGKPASSNSCANSSVEAEVNSEGLATTVQPAASAGASFQASSSNGEFHGVMAATTPTGSWRVKAK